MRNYTPPTPPPPVFLGCGQISHLSCLITAKENAACGENAEFANVNPLNTELNPICQ